MLLHLKIFSYLVFEIRARKDHKTGKNNITLNPLDFIKVAYSSKFMNILQEIYPC